MMKELTYTKQGEYYLPNLTLEETGEQPLGKYGMMRRSFLQENKPILYNDLILKGKLFDHLREIEETAKLRREQMMKELLEKNPAPDKKTHQMEWVQHMNALKAQAEEVILNELINS